METNAILLKVRMANTAKNTVKLYPLTGKLSFTSRAKRPKYECVNEINRRICAVAFILKLGFPIAHCLMPGKIRSTLLEQL